MSKFFRAPSILILIFFQPCPDAHAKSCENQCSESGRRAHAQCERGTDDEIKGFEAQAANATDAYEAAASARQRCAAMYDMHRALAGENSARADLCTDEWKKCFSTCDKEIQCLDDLESEERDKGRKAHLEKKSDEAQRHLDKAKMAQGLSAQKRLVLRSCRKLRDTHVQPLDSAALNHQGHQIAAHRCTDDFFFNSPNPSNYDFSSDPKGTPQPKTRDGQVVHAPASGPSGAAPRPSVRAPATALPEENKLGADKSNFTPSPRRAALFAEFTDCSAEDPREISTAEPEENPCFADLAVDKGEAEETDLFTMPDEAPSATDSFVFFD